GVGADEQNPGAGSDVSAGFGRLVLTSCRPLSPTAVRIIVHAVLTDTVTKDPEHTLCRTGYLNRYPVARTSKLPPLSLSFSRYQRYFSSSSTRGCRIRYNRALQSIVKFSDHVV